MFFVKKIQPLRKNAAELRLLFVANPVNLRPQFVKLLF